MIICFTLFVGLFSRGDCTFLSVAKSVSIYCIVESESECSYLTSLLLFHLAGRNWCQAVIFGVFEGAKAR